MRYLVMFATGDIETTFHLTDEDYNKVQSEDIDLVYDTKSSKELVATDEGPRWVPVARRKRLATTQTKLSTRPSELETLGQ